MFGRYSLKEIWFQALMDDLTQLSPYYKVINDLINM